MAGAQRMMTCIQGIVTFFKQSQSSFAHHFLANRAAPISVSLAFGPHIFASTVNATVGGWTSGSTVCFTSMLFPEVLNTGQGNSM